MNTTRHLRVVESPRAAEPVETVEIPDLAADAHEDYWARVQQLRADLARLRPAN